MFSFFDMAAIVVTFAALLSWINNKYLPLSPTAGLLALSAGASGLLIRVQLRDGGDHIGPAVEEVTHQSQLRALCRDGRERGLRLVGAFGGGEAGDQQ